MTSSVVENSTVQLIGIPMIYKPNGPMNQEVYPAIKTNQHGFWSLLIFWLEPIQNFWSGSKFDPLRGRTFRHLFMFLPVESPDLKAGNFDP